MACDSDCASDFSGSGSPVSNVWTLNRQHAQQSESRTAALQTYTLQSCTIDLMAFVTAVSGLISARAICPIYNMLEIFDLFAQVRDGRDEDRYEAAVVKCLVLVVVVELA